MKSVKIITSLLLFFVAINTANAQTTSTEMLKDWERAKVYTQEYLDAVPETGYALKPTPEMRSFADQMLHLASANYMFITAASGDKMPDGVGELEKKGEKSKAAVTKSVLDSYDFVLAALKKIDTKQLSEKVKLFGRFELTKEQAIDKAFEHQTHHRGQTTVYLRLAGATPPAEKLF